MTTEPEERDEDIEHYDADDYADEPNEAGFAGDPSTPQPERQEEHPFGEVDAESIAIPSGDLTEALAEALEPGEQSDRDS